MPADAASSRLRPALSEPSDCLRDEPRWKDLYATARAAVQAMKEVLDEEKLSRRAKARLTYAIEELETACDEYDGEFRGRLLLAAAGGLAGEEVGVTIRATPPEIEALAQLPPRIRRMLELLLLHQDAICEPKKGVLELHFNGRHIAAQLVGYQLLWDDRHPPAPGDDGDQVVRPPNESEDLLS